MRAMQNLYKKIKMKTIASTRLILKPLSEYNISEQYLAWMNNRDILMFTESRWKDYTKEDLVDFVKKINASDRDFLFGIFIAKSQKHIGNIKIGNIDNNHKFADLGIIIGEKSEWGKGYATEAIKLALDFAFSALGLYKVTAGVYSNNTGSLKALKRAGFSECGTYHNHCIFNNERVDVIMLEIFKKD